MASTRLTKAPRRAPNGVVSDKPVAVRFKPEEIARAQRIAEKEQRSLAAVCRLATLAGFDAYERDRTALTPSS